LAFDGAAHVSFKVRQATIDDLDELVPLFDAYRQFYGQDQELDLARSFLGDRLERNDSVIFIACASDGTGVGFTQLYPSFSSTMVTFIFILNDLFVAPDTRAMGVGSALLKAAARFGQEVGAARLTLSTAADNTAAQTLYRSMGWERSEAFWTYNLSLV
jgi:ribosomal protein S18 acetylase RimI-like enzyme